MNLSPSRVIGHARLQLSTTQPNLVEGREFASPQAIALCPATGAIYVADTANNRVLGWRSASGFGNGAMADVVLGQRDRYTTSGLGPGTSLSSGLSAPAGVAVDSSGNVYVADAGNHRVVRYPAPFSQPDEQKLADMVIGQANLSGTANGCTTASRTNLCLNTRGTPFRAGMQFDAQGNLYLSDAGSHRILRYPAGSLGAGAANNPPADLVLGQQDFNSREALPGTLSAANRILKTGLREPGAIALDQAGRLFVSDSLNRICVYAPPFANGKNIDRIMGIVVVAQGQPVPPPINEYTVGVALTSPARAFPAEGVFTIGNVPFVIDTPVHRILRYDPFDQWPAENVSFSPPARAVIGQDSLTQDNILSNRGRVEPAANTFSSPVAGAYRDGQTYIADSGNARVLAFADLSSGPVASAGAPYEAARVLGQDGFEFRAPNLIEGREFFFNTGGFTGAAMAIDRQSNPPRLYVADPLNHRVLGFADARNVRPGAAADIVIGQPDFRRGLANYPTNSASQRNDSGLLLPIDVALDGDGNLWVADSGNGRVLRFPAPFSQSGMPKADLVIGQSDFTARITDASARTLASPAGIAFTFAGSLLVSDSAHHRVLRYDRPFSNGMAATRVFGQPDFSSIASGNTDNRFNTPRHIAVDTDDRLYVADAVNNRVQIFSNANVAGQDPRAILSLTRDVRAPLSVVVSFTTGEVWVTAGPANRVLRFPRFDDLIAVGNAPNYAVPALGPIAVELDASGSLYIADAANRIAIHYPGALLVNGASYLSRATPGMIASLYPVNYTFTDSTVVFNELPNPVPLPTVLGDLQILVDDKPVPIYFVSPGQINFLMPNDAPASGTVELQVVQASQGRVIAASQVRMDVASPAFFTSAASGTGQIAALNEDGSVNSSSNGLPRGRVVQLFGTGAGHIPGAPPDGSPPSGAISTPSLPRVIVNGRFLDDADVLYSGLAPGLVGVWQVNIRIPENTPPSNSILVVLLMNDIPSNNPQNVNQIRTTVAVR